MEYSDVYKQSNSLVQFSSDGHLVVNVVGHKLVIRDAESLQVITVLTSPDSISTIQFSPDNQLILCACYDLGIVSVYDLQQEYKLVAQIEEGVCGCVRVQFDLLTSRAILTWSALSVKITVWHLLDQSATIITHPKYIHSGASFRKDAFYLAILDRCAGKDWICIYGCSNYQQCKRFQIATTDASDLSWSPDGRHIAVWDSILDFNVLIYSPEGTLLHTYAPYEHGLGVRDIVWSPTSQLLAVGGYDQKCHLLNHFSFNPILYWPHVSHLILTHQSSVTIFRELGDNSLSSNDDLNSMHFGLPLNELHQPFPQFLLHSLIDVLEMMIHGGLVETIMPPQPDEPEIEMTFPVIRLDPDQSAKKVGVSMIRWSADGRFIALKNETTPTMVYIYSLKTLNMVALLQLLLPIKAMEWMRSDTNKYRLILCTGSANVYQWNGSVTLSKETSEPIAFTTDDESTGDDPSGTVNCLGVPMDEMNVNSFTWNLNETQLILLDKARFCVGFVSTLNDVYSS